VNRVREVKPGAVTLITGSMVPGGRAGEPGEKLSGYTQPVLVYQRYGRGLSIALPIQDSWSWQMDPAASENDQTFERFWRQMLRWLTSDVPNRVVVTLPTDQANPKNPISIRASVADSLFIARNDAKVVAHVVSDGVKRDIRWTGPSIGMANIARRSRRNRRASTAFASTPNFRTAARRETRRTCASPT
jgi:hypothetical protein